MDMAQIAQKSTRKLTIARKWIRARRCIVPAIRLEGDWLHELGFRPGANVQVEMANGRLIITPQFSS